MTVCMYQMPQIRLCLKSANLRCACNVKLSHPGSNLDFLINPDSDPDVCQVTPKMLWIHYLVRGSRFVE